MNTMIKLASVLLLFLTACSASYHTTSWVDDVYYTPKVLRPGAGSGASVNEIAAVEAPAQQVDVSQSQNFNSSVQNNTYEEPSYNYNTDYLGYNQGDDTLSGYADEDDNLYINNYYYGDYYDFAYSSRIRRFYRQMAIAGYYDPFYTNMYWYNFDPAFSGVSIYLGYGSHMFYYPGYYWNPSFSWYGPYNDYLWGYGPFGYSYWNRPFYNSFYYGYPFGFSSGYYAGYYGGYYGGYYYNPYYYQYIYNSYDQSNYRYGPRQAVGSTIRTGETRHAETFADRFELRTARNAAGVRETIDPEGMYPARVAGRNSGVAKTGDEMGVRPDRGNNASGRMVSEPRTSAGQSGRSAGEGTSLTRPPSGASAQTPGSPARTRPANDPSSMPDARTTTRPQVNPAPSSATREAGSQVPTRVQGPVDAARTQAPNQRYSRPAQENTPSQSRENQPNYTPPRTYTSPSYQQPRSNEQYRNLQNTRPAAVAPPREATRPATEGDQPQRQQVQPQNMPQRQDRGQPTYTPPSRQQPSQSVTRPSSTPSRSPFNSPSMSAPSRSPSSSSPARSSGSSMSPSRSSGGGSSAAPSRSSGSSSGSRSSGGRTGRP